jgi:hypothetical protein
MEGRAMIQAPARRRNYDARELPRVFYVVCQVIAVEEYFLLREKDVFFYSAFTRCIFVTVEMSQSFVKNIVP